MEKVALVAVKPRVKPRHAKSARIQQKTLVAVKPTRISKVKSMPLKARDITEKKEAKKIEVIKCKSRMMKKAKGRKKEPKVEDGIEVIYLNPNFAAGYESDRDSLFDEPRFAHMIPK